MPENQEICLKFLVKLWPNQDFNLPLHSMCSSALSFHWNCTGKASGKPSHRFPCYRCQRSWFSRQWCNSLPRSSPRCKGCCFAGVGGKMETWKCLHNWRSSPHNHVLNSEFHLFNLKRWQTLQNPHLCPSLQKWRQNTRIVDTKATDECTNSICCPCWRWGSGSSDRKLGNQGWLWNHHRKSVNVCRILK